MAIPVIVLTSLSQQNAERLIQEGAEAYFEKSTLNLDKNSDSLATTVETVLHRCNQRKQHKVPAPALGSRPLVSGKPQ